MTQGFKSATVYRPGRRLAPDLATACGSDPDIALAATDEDGLTLGWEALSLCSDDFAHTRAVTLSMSDPGIEPRAMAAHLAATGAISPDVELSVVAGSAGCTGLLSTALSGNRPASLVCSDHVAYTSRNHPLAHDDVAVACLAGTPTAFEVITSASKAVLSFDRWRTGGPDDPKFVEETLARIDGPEVLHRLVKEASVTLGDLHTVVVTAPIALRTRRWAEAWGVSAVVQAATPVSAEQPVAAPLATALECLRAGGPGSLIAVLDLSWGGSAVLLRAGDDVASAITVLDRAARAPIEVAEWLRRGSPDPKTSIWTSPAKLRREAGDHLGLIGSCCDSCGQVAFPTRLACDSCGATTLSPRRLRRTGTVLSHNIDTLYGAPDREIQMVVVDLDDGGRAYVQLVADAHRSAVVGDRVRLRLRRLHNGARLPHYFWKADLDD